MPDETKLLYAFNGILLFIYVSDLIPSLKTLNGSPKSKCSKCSGLSLERLPGIDINALSICRQKGLM